MLLGETSRYPDDRHCLQTGCIGQQLPEVNVIRPLQLVLDQYPRAAANVLAQHIRTERADSFLLRLQLKINT